MMTDGVFIQAKAKGESAFVSRAANPASFDWRLQCATKGRGKSMTEKWMLRDLIAKNATKCNRQTECNLKMSTSFKAINVI